MAADKRTHGSRPTPDDADVLRRAIHALGDYGHVSVRAVRGHLTICVDEGVPVARATPLVAGQFGLSFHTHTGRWEPMPVVADLTRLAHDLVDSLVPTFNGGTFPTGKAGRTTSASGSALFAVGAARFAILQRGSCLLARL